MSQQYEQKQICLPYEVDAPFGKYSLQKKDEFVYRLFQNNLIPRDIVFRTFFRRSMQRYKSGILDVIIDGISMRIKPEFNISEAAFLRRGDKVDCVEIKFLVKACRESSNPVFVDIGANVGLYSLLLSKKISRLQVIAVEPHPEISKQLEYNISLNPSFNISVLKSAVSDCKTTIRMQTNYEDLGSSRIEKFGDVEVECETLNSIVQKHCPRGIDALKVDVEGYEDKVLIPYLETASSRMYPKTIVLEVSPQIWTENPIDVAISKGYVEVKRTRMNSILVYNGAS